MRLPISRLSILGLMLASQFSIGYSQSDEDLVNQGIQAFRARDFRKAGQIFSIVVERDPSAVTFNYLAMSEWSAGDVDRAIAHFERSIQLGNNSASVHYNLGLAYLKQHRIGQGIRQTQQALAIDPKFKAARYTLAVALLDAGHPREAIPYLAAVREESPCDSAIWANLARAQFECGDLNSALQTVDQAVEAMPTRVALIITVALLCSHYQQFQKARHLLENASEVLPEDPDIKFLLAKVSLQLKEPIEALAVLKTVPVDHGGHGEVPYLRGVALALVGKTEDAASQFAAANTADPQNVRYLIAQAWAFQLQRRHDDALTALTKAGQLDPQAAIVHYRKAVSYVFLRRYDRAAEACEEAIRLAPKYDSAYLLLGVAKLEQGDVFGAQTSIEHAVALKPNVALYHRELGVALLKGKNLTVSRKELDRALVLDPKAAQAYFWRARVLASQGKRHQAITDLESVVAIQPDIVDAYSDLARLYTEEGQSQKAAMILAKQKEVKDARAPDDPHEFLSDLADPLL